MKKPASVILAALILSACQTGQTRLIATVPPEPLVCNAWRPISYASRHDTAATILEIRRNNARQKAYCAAKS